MYEYILSIIVPCNIFKVGKNVCLASFPALAMFCSAALCCCYWWWWCNCHFCKLHSEQQLARVFLCHSQSGSSSSLCMQFISRQKDDHRPWLIYTAPENINISAWENYLDWKYISCWGCSLAYLYCRAALGEKCNFSCLEAGWLVLYNISSGEGWGR